MSVSVPAPAPAIVGRPPWAMTALGVAYMAALVLLPLGMVFVEAFRRGPEAYLAVFRLSDTWSAIRLTLTVAAISVPLNAAFGVAAAWATTKFEFKGKSLLVTLIDLPFSVSPVISGLVWVLLFGASGWLAGLVEATGVKVLFATTGLVLATTFITLPFVARELIPLMQEQGSDEESAAITLGAGGWTTFFRVTLPNIRWALVYGVLLSNARAMGEFGAVSVVSGHIRGKTNTLPLHVEILYNEYDFVGAFAAASVLAALALVTLAIKALLERRFAGELSARARH